MYQPIIPIQHGTDVYPFLDFAKFFHKFANPFFGFLLLGYYIVNASYWFVFLRSHRLIVKGHSIECAGVVWYNLKLNKRMRFQQCLIIIPGPSTTK